MSLKFGLNLKKKDGPAPAKKSIWDEPDDEDDDGAQTNLLPSPPSRTTGRFGLNVPPKQKDDGPPRRLKPLDLDEESDQPNKSVSLAQNVDVAEQDQSIYDYDSFHDAKSTMDEARKAAAKKDAIDRKPKYINNLLDAAARRKQDQQVAKERMLQKEREAEGDEFADKDKFVTGAYKQQQEENRRLEEEERKKAEADDERKRRLGGGMQSLYRSMMDQTEEKHQQAMQATAELKKNGSLTEKPDEQRAKSDAELLSADMKAKGIRVNEDGQVVDKRELLIAGLNVAPSGRDKNGGGSDHLKTSAQSHRSAFAKRDFAAEQAQRERQSRMINEQLEATTKRKREEEEQQRAADEREAKSKKTEQDVSDAKARYLARKAARERGEG